MSCLIKKGLDFKDGLQGINMAVIKFNFKYQILTNSLELKMEHIAQLSNYTFSVSFLINFSFEKEGLPSWLL